MPDLFELLRQWWKQMFAVVIVSLLVIGTITFLKPRQYLSVATAVPASAYSTDKGAIFNENIQGLYSALGNPDDLDLVLGTAALDTVYIAIASAFDLKDHYKIHEGPEAILKTAIELRKKTKVMKSEYGELKVKVWDVDKQLAANLANAIMDNLKEIHANLRSVSNSLTLEGLVDGKNKLINMPDSSASLKQSQLVEYEKLIGQYQLMIDSKPAVLITVEKAKPALWPDKPRRKQVLVATALLSFLFSFFAALILESRKS